MSTGHPGQSTLAVWGGETEHAPYERSTQVPVVHSISFGYDDIDTWHAVALGHEEGHIYSRNTNPTVRAFEDKVKALEGADSATSFSSGMAARFAAAAQTTPCAADQPAIRSESATPERWNVNEAAARCRSRAGADQLDSSSSTRIVTP